MTSLRPAWTEIDLGAIGANTRALAKFAAPAQLLAVVKADGYGHGAVPVARAALDAGATCLGVALVEEGVELRDAGIESRILLLSEAAPGAAETVVAQRLTPVVYTSNGVEALAKAVADAGAESLPVHLKIDTGMHRVGCSPDDVAALVEGIDARPELVLDGVCTHFAAADDPDPAATNAQLARFERCLAGLPRRPDIVHAANSAGLLAHPAARFDLVRVGIALYGIPPTPALNDVVTVRPALSLKARVSHVKRLPAGAAVSYGMHYTLPREATIATVPVGYADGVPRNLGLTGGEVLIGGRRHPIAGAVTMDQLMVDLGDAPVEVGDEVVLLGRQGSLDDRVEVITAHDWSQRLGVIPYEVVTGIGPRVPRLYPARTRLDRA
jgi:alanine racemase